MPAPSVFTVMRHILSRAFRETGQALDRAGLRGVVHAKQGRRMGTDDPYKFNDHFSRHRQMMGLLRRGQPTLPGLTAGNYTNENQIGDEKNQSVAFLAPCATLIGNVHLAPNTSIFYKALLKADVAAHGINLIQSAEEEERWKNLPVGGYERTQDAGKFDTAGGLGHPTIGGANGGGIYIGEGTNIQDGCIVTSLEGHATVGKYVTVGHMAHIHSATVGDESLIGMGAVLKPGSVVESQSFVAAGAVVERGEVVKRGEIWGGNPARKLRDLTTEEKAKLRVQAEKYIHVAQSHNHVEDLGGNVPDSFIEHELLGSGNSSETLPIQQLEPEDKASSPNGLNGANLNGDVEKVLPNDQSRQHENRQGDADKEAEEIKIGDQQQRQ